MGLQKAWVSLWCRGQSPLNLLDVLFWRIYRLSTSPTNKKLEVWTQYRLLLSVLGGYMYMCFSSFKKTLRQRKICKKS